MKQKSNKNSINIINESSLKINYKTLYAESLGCSKDELIGSFIFMTTDENNSLPSKRFGDKNEN